MNESPVIVYPLLAREVNYHLGEYESTIVFHTAEFFAQCPQLPSCYGIL